MKKKKDIDYTWAEFHATMKQMSKWLKSIEFNFDNIYGIGLDGKVMALNLQPLIKLPIIVDKKKITGRTLILDGVSRTGKTYLKLMKQFKNYPLFATLYVDATSAVTPDYYAEVNEKGAWINFPWGENAK